MEPNKAKDPVSVRDRAVQAIFDALTSLGPPESGVEINRMSAEAERLVSNRENLIRLSEKPKAPNDAPPSSVPQDGPYPYAEKIAAEWNRAEGTQDRIYKCSGCGVAAGQSHVIGCRLSTDNTARIRCFGCSALPQHPHLVGCREARQNQQYYKATAGPAESFETWTRRELDRTRVGLHDRLAKLEQQRQDAAMAEAGASSTPQAQGDPSANAWEKTLVRHGSVVVDEDSDVGGLIRGHNGLQDVDPKTSLTRRQQSASEHLDEDIQNQKTADMLAALKRDAARQSLSEDFRRRYPSVAAVLETSERAIFRDIDKIASPKGSDRRDG